MKRPYRNSRRSRFVVLSDKRIALLRAIAEHLRQYNYAPSIRELCAACDIAATSDVQYHLRVLERAAYLEIQRLPNGRMIPHLLRLTDAGARIQNEAQQVTKGANTTPPTHTAAATSANVKKENKNEHTKYNQ